MSNNLILAFADPAATLERAGGKGASLARMAAAGLPVPPGFHVTTDAYRHFADGLRDQILRAVDTDRPEVAADKIAALFVETLDAG
jgi:pyruvate,water dikinase